MRFGSINRFYILRILIIGDLVDNNIGFDVLRVGKYLLIQLYYAK